MSIHLQKVLRHAEKKLAKAAEQKPTDALDIYRTFLKLEEHRLFLAHRAGEGGLNFVHKRAATLDIVLRHIWQTALQSAQRAHPKNFSADSVALVATGGFGRGELCPYSDVDLLFLCASKLTELPKNIIEQILYVLWDVGFKVGHATRTLEEAAQEANKDFRTKTSLLDARFIAGPEKLYQDFLQRFQRSCLDGKETEYLEWRLRDQTERHQKYGGTACVQEPNLKNGCGGLRDYQSLLWVARVRAGICTTAALVEKGWLAQTDRKRLDRAYDFILRIRNELHYRQKRGDDTLTLKMQGQIAAAFHYPQKHTLRRIEAFMRDYYEAARDIFQIANLLSRRLYGQKESKGERIWSFLQTKKHDDLKLDGLVLKNNELHYESRSTLSDPLRILRAFQIMQRHNASLSAELETLIRSKLHLINRRLLWLPKAREMLMDILKKKGKVGRIFRAMHETGVLGRLIPEFAPLTCLVQHEFFHVYTADEHTLVCLEQLDKVVDCPDEPFPKYRELFLECEQPETLYLALVLHDVGKAHHVPHHYEVSAQLATRFARRMKLKSHAFQTLLFLVYHHSTLTEFAQRRNLDDAGAIREFARMVKDKEKLDMLMLLTFADAQGVRGKTNWTGWKELLVWNLYHRAKEMLQGEEEFFKKAELNRKETIRRVRAALARRLAPEEIQAHFDLLPRGYLNCSSEELIVRHIEQVHDFFLKHLQSEDSLKPFVRWLDKSNE
ncbi:MAG: [protein-PII] uridylyltransferase, partial [bacterium]